MEESQQNRETVLFPELVHGLIQQRGQLLPRCVGVCGLNFHLCRLSFALPPPAFGPQNVGGRKARRPIEPSDQRRSVAQTTGLTREQAKHCLRDFLRQVRIAKLPEGCGIDQVGIAMHERRERRVGAAFREFTQ